MKKKVLALTICLAMIAIAVIGGTLAYFTDETEVKTNTLTVGKVDIELTEPAWDEDAEHILMPGVSFYKDPTIHVTADSENAWLFLDVTIKDASSLISIMYLQAEADHEGMTDFPTTRDDFKTKLFEDPSFREAIVDRWIVGIDHDKWKSFEVISGNDQYTFRFGYKDIAIAGGPGVTFMTAIKMPENVTSAMKENAHFTDIELDFQAYAVQATQVATLDAAHDILWTPATSTP